MTALTIVVDGNDGTGKSTLAAALRARGYDVRDRGVPTKKTDDPSVAAVAGELYLVLDAPVPTCRERLAQAGKDLDEQYHTVADLEHYRARFLDVVAALPGALLVDADGPPGTVLERALRALEAAGVRP